MRRLPVTAVPWLLCASALTSTTTPAAAQSRQWMEGRDLLAGAINATLNRDYDGALYQLELAGQAFRVADPPPGWDHEFALRWSSVVLGMQEAYVLTLADRRSDSRVPAARDVVDLAAQLLPGADGSIVAEEHMELVNRIAWWGGWRPTGGGGSYRGDEPLPGSRGSVHSDVSVYTDYPSWQYFLAASSSRFPVSVSHLDLHPPQGTRESVTGGQISLSWDPVPGAAIYGIEMQAGAEPGSLDGAFESEGEWPYRSHLLLHWPNGDATGDGRPDRAYENLDPQTSRSTSLSVTWRSGYPYGRWRVRALAGGNAEGLPSAWRVFRAR